MNKGQTINNYSAAENNKVKSPSSDTPVTFVTLGTLGDCFVVYCKLYDYHQQTGRKMRLIRYSRYPEHDGVISALYSQVPFIEYELPCYSFPSHKYLRNLVADMPADHYYVNINHNGTTDWIAPDPDFIRMEPFPEYHPASTSLIGEDGFHIGIQLHSGRSGSNYKGFSLAWLDKFMKAVQSQPVTLHLFGTGDGYNLSKLEKFSRQRGIRNHVGKTSFLEWVAFIKMMSAFITMEGFAGYFSMSQRVPTYVYTPLPRATLRRTPPAWRENNVIVDISGDSPVLIRKARNALTLWLKYRAKYAPRNIVSVVDFIRMVVERAENTRI
jgi:hypothetical protein